jgi:hypothetical protein
VSDCDNYCDFTKAVCNGTTLSDKFPFADRATCMTACATWPAGNPTDTDTATLGCRTYHIYTGLTLGDKLTHCPHGGATSAPCINAPATTTGTTTAGTTTAGTTTAGTTTAGTTTSATTTSASTTAASSTTAKATTGTAGAASLAPVAFVVLAAALLA